MWWNERFTSWMCRRQICSNCVMLSWQYEPKSLRNVSNTLLNLCHEELMQFWRKKGSNPVLASVPNKVTSECTFTLIHLFLIILLIAMYILIAIAINACKLLQSNFMPNKCCLLQSLVVSTCLCLHIGDFYSVIKVIQHCVWCYSHMSSLCLTGKQHGAFIFTELLFQEQTCVCHDDYLWW